MTLETLENINAWHQRARPEPTPENLIVQMGCHFEEVAEMLEALESSDPDDLLGDALTALTRLANAMKSSEINVTIGNRLELLDALADQVVTVVGVGHCAGMKVTEACDRVNTSNWSKYDVHGNPIFKANGKIDKGPGYASPDLSGLY